ncbi:RNA polymerase sigma factor [Bacillus sp. 03113]|uniref:RNA polymerase sigma factor n=1 Tax=Bacillus sp. 03113 TaxID=2578211 RepID=UPI0015E8876B|nr:RNA polymerase sigma factor [Bacillus sp. 03113]
MSTINFSEVYCMYYKRLFHISYSITRDIYIAEDVVHETFIKALKKVETIEEESKIGAWLSMIATRTAIDFVRRERKKKGIPMEQNMLESLGKEMKQNVEEEAEVEMLVEQVNIAIKSLTFEYQDVLMLKLGHGLKENEIAHVLNLKPSTVKTRIYRARKQLKQLFLVHISA